MKNVKRHVLNCLFQSLTGISEPKKYRPVADVERYMPELKNRLTLDPGTFKQMKEIMTSYARKMEKVNVHALDFPVLRELKELQLGLETNLSFCLSPRQLHSYRHWRHAQILQACNTDFRALTPQALLN